MTNLNDMSKEEILEILNLLKSKFEHSNVRIGDNSTSIYFFNCKNSVNVILTVTNNLLHVYEINPEELKNER